MFTTRQIDKDSNITMRRIDTKRIIKTSVNVQTI